MGKFQREERVGNGVTEEDTEKYRVETLNWRCLLISWALTKENQKVLQGRITWLQGLKNYSQ